MSESPSQIDAVQLVGEVKSRALRLGFDLIGIAKADKSRYRDYLRRWLDDGRAGTMDYLSRRFEERSDPRVYLKGAKSIICVAVNYHVPLKPIDSSERRHHGRIARYALGDDYHELMKNRLRALADWLRRTIPGAQTRTAVDTAPMMEKELAARSGIGWLGKNTCVINQSIGSWLLLGEIITTLKLPPDDPAVDRCGTCRRCIDACPTNAITAPYQLDARRCISYLNIEHRGEISTELQRSLGDWLYGCDICQEVCPWNGRAARANDPALQPRFPAGSVDVRSVLTWTPESYRSELRNSAMKRVKLPILQRNAGMVQTNLERTPDLSISPPRPENR